MAKDARDRLAARAAEDEPTGLAALIAGAGQKDLDQIDRNIAEYDGRIHKLHNQRSGLVLLRKSVELVVHGRPAVVRRDTKKTLRIVAIEELLADGKSRSPAAIAAATKIPVGSLHVLLKDARFARDGDGWTLSKKAS